MISIIVPCYNTDSTLTKSVKSLCSQTVSSYQIVLVDDGATDNTPQICDDLARNDSRIKVVHQENRGLLGAWKRGVNEADGDFVAFCDADDYLDVGFIEKIEGVICNHDPDLITFGMIAEYSNGERVRTINRLAPGEYDETAIKQSILPRLLSDGGMQSEILIKSRWSKVFRKELLLAVIDDLDERVSLGEDELTLFAVIQSAKKLFCMDGYCPYHYVRHSMSMIGQFDKRVFEKIDILYKGLDHIAGKYSYPYRDQLLYDRLSVTLLFVKKYICRSTDGYRMTMEMVRQVRDSSEVKECIKYCSIDRYDKGAKIFAGLFINRDLFFLYFLTRVFEKVRGRDV